MISLRTQLGQASIEFLMVIAMTVFIFVLVTYLLIRGFLTVVATRYAAENARCFAILGETASCGVQTRRALESYFSFREVNVKTSVTRSVIHTEITGRMMGLPIHGAYDLGPSEFKRRKK